MDENLLKMVALYNMLSWYFTRVTRPEVPKNIIKTDTLLEELKKLYEKERQNND